ncbi:apolipoprotein N-acyltransferase [Microvirga arsenatis]|uniref:Apolipoprotein N-acyltransferase n=1 Tax=Microvirga arsenatis TaxID=2692265 RepID=A0ABW9YW24_9HYPH|nr:apolipoprotein N-acyltransferase [Microvirga arsenatis]NBJ13567.1 apolipoprotein N-acyltransferase [Microvirga arsenatis]NBJ23876.1 apolipoprotein N-acyltransferase [Microvirga arsenatis]
MSPLAKRAILLRGWRRWLAAFAAGAVGALAMPPFGFLPALVLSLVPAIWLLDGTAIEGASRWGALRAAALVGWFWGFGYFVAGLWWLGAAFLVEADLFAWAMPFGVLGLPALLAFFPAFGFALARLLWLRDDRRILAFAFGMTIAEWLRGHLFTGFPWNSPGMALGQSLWLMQSASLVGLYGLTFASLCIGAAPAVLLTGRTARGRWLAPGLAALVLLAMALFGLWRVPAEASATVPDVRLRIMQPNLPQDAKFNPRNREPIMRHYLTLSASRGGSGGAAPTHILWPESAFPFLLHRDPASLAQIAALLEPGSVLITGAARMDEPLPGEAAGKFYNAIQVIDDRGTILSSYDKVHLVPFGEYVPRFLDALIRAVGLRQFVHIPGGFEPGERRAALAVPGLPPAAATICYEAIFPGGILGDGPRPSLILNVTNDAWFGRTPGPHQHFAQARLRAVEEGLPLVRAANTGISAVVDPFGRITGQIPLGVEGAMDASLPVAQPATLYSHSGRFSLTATLVICLMILVVRRGRQSRF